jgi:hypothetical protein
MGTLLFLLLILSPFIFGLQGTIIVAVIWLAYIIFFAAAAYHHE